MPHIFLSTYCTQGENTLMHLGTRYVHPVTRQIFCNLCEWTVNQFTKTFFWNFQNSKADLWYILIDKQMLEKVFCSNIALSSSSGNHLFYKAEYMRRRCPNQVWAITFEWSALATWNSYRGIEVFGIFYQKNAIFYK